MTFLCCAAEFAILGYACQSGISLTGGVAIASLALVGELLVGFSGIELGSNGLDWGSDVLPVGVCRLSKRRMVSKISSLCALGKERKTDLRSR